MGKSNFAVFVDLENVGAKESMLRYIIEKVKIRGDILLGTVYGYTDRYSDLKLCLLSNTFSVVPSLRYGKCQKNNLDIQLVIDAMKVAYVNPLIDSFCIVSGDSDYQPLVAQLKSMGKHVLGISRSEAASEIFISACNEFIFLESVAVKRPEVKKSRSKDERAADGDINELVTQVITILEDQDEEQMYASELKDTLNRLRPDFSERSYGCATFGKLMGTISDKSPRLRVWTDQSSLMVGLSTSDTQQNAKLDKSNWLPAFTQALERFKNDGFDRVNPSILKATIQAEYPDFDEKQIGFKRFSDVMKALEKEKLLVVEMDEAHTMLLKIN
ncbi:MAG: NYN domain-containing protein [Clostridiales bacterium]|nr:NYN domain-containing protein [Clostridiales bacterium]OPZ67033.1 MAG: NYN domain protein [Firmicutes bacterium ADurb.Bin467]